MYFFLKNDFGYKKGFRKGSIFEKCSLNQNQLPSNKPIDFTIPEGKTKEQTFTNKMLLIKFAKNYFVKWEKFSDYLDMIIFEIT